LVGFYGQSFLFESSGIAVEVEGVAVAEGGDASGLGNRVVGFDVGLSDAAQTNDGNIDSYVGSFDGVGRSADSGKMSENQPGSDDFQEVAAGRCAVWYGD
jgi:hypothetical protein